MAWCLTLIKMEDDAPRHPALCLFGHMSLRRFVCCLWLVLAPPLKGLESVCLGWPARFMRQAFAADPYTTLACLVLGVGLSQMVFFPWARASQQPHTHAQSTPAVVCTTYLSLLAWLAGQLATGIAVFAGLLRRFKPRTRCLCMRLRWRCFTTLGDGGYLALLMGLGWAFPVAYMQNSERTEEVEWCRAGDDTPAELIYVPLGFISCFLGVVRFRSLKRGLHPDSHPLGSTELSAVAIVPTTPPHPFGDIRVDQLDGPTRQAMQAAYALDKASAVIHTHNRRGVGVEF